MDGWAEYLNIMEHALIRVNLKQPQDCGYNGAENTGEKKEEKKTGFSQCSQHLCEHGVNVDECWCQLFLYWADRTIYSPTYFPLQAENGAPNLDQNTLLIPAEIMSIHNGSSFFPEHC